MNLTPELISRLVARDRERQGLPEHIEDESVLRAVAVIVAPVVKAEREGRKAA